MSININTATAVLSRDFATFDTAAQGDPAKADDIIGQEDLQAIVNDRSGRYTPEQVETAKFLLDSTAARSFLDVAGDGSDPVNGGIGRGDVDAALKITRQGGETLDRALLDTASGNGMRDGIISEVDLNSAGRDPGLDPGLRDAISKVPSNLPGDTQVSAALALKANAEDPDAIKIIAELVNSQAFKGLNQPQQLQAIALFGGARPSVGGPLSLGYGENTSSLARHQLADERDEQGRIKINPNLEGEPEMLLDLDDPNSLQQYLRDFARPADKWREVLAPEGLPDSSRHSYSVDPPLDTTPAPVEHTFPDGGGQQEAYKRTITIGDKSVEMYEPVNKDPRYDYMGADQVAKSLAALPPDAFDRLNQVNLNPEPAKTESGEPDFGVFMSIRTHKEDPLEGLVNTFPRPKGNAPTQGGIDTAMLHEVGHFYDPRYLDLGLHPGYSGGGIVPLGNQWIADWERGRDSDAMAPTPYANASIGEDFAEAYMIYQLVIGTPDEAQMRALMPERFAYLDQIMSSGESRFPPR